MSELKPEDKALIERVLSPLWVNIFSRDAWQISTLLDAARAEGPRPKPSQEAVERVTAIVDKLIRAASVGGSITTLQERRQDAITALLASFSDAPSDGGA